MNLRIVKSAAIALLPFASFLKAQEKPNIVVILADDLASNEISCYGGQNLRTPNIDRIAEEGIRFTNNYASCAMSVPIRASLYTGLYPARNGSYQNHKTSYPDIKSITHYLPQAGYRVGRAGKTHTTPRKVYDFEKVPGFEENCVSSTAFYTVDGIREFMQRDDTPFCLFVCSIHPHAPWTWGNPGEFDADKIILPPNCVDNKGTRTLFRRFLAEIRALDNEVGSVLKVLEETGKLDNTLVIFLGEQGPQLPGGKWTCWNYGQNSALVARFPNRIKANSTTDAIVQYEDVVPTLMEFAGGDKIEGIDGISYLDVLFGKKKNHRPFAYGIHNNIPEGTAYPIRSIRDKRYKLIVNLTPDVEYFEKHLMNVKNERSVWASWLESTATDERARMFVDRYVKRPAVEFYDMQNDPWEMNNLAGEKKYAKRIARMQTELAKWMRQQGDTGAAMDVEIKKQQ